MLPSVLTLRVMIQLTQTQKSWREPWDCKSKSKSKIKSECVNRAYLDNCVGWICHKIIQGRSSYRCWHLELTLTRKSQCEPEIAYESHINRAYLSSRTCRVWISVCQTQSTCCPSRDSADADTEFGSVHKFGRSQSSCKCWHSDDLWLRWQHTEEPMRACGPKSKLLAKSESRMIIPCLLVQ